MKVSEPVPAGKQHSNVADAKREGTLVQFTGRLRVWNERLEMVSDDATILEAAVNPFLEASNKWAEEESNNPTPSGNAPDDSGAVPEPCLERTLTSTSASHNGWCNNSVPWTRFAQS